MLHVSQQPRNSLSCDADFCHVDSLRGFTRNALPRKHPRNACGHILIEYQSNNSFRGATLVIVAMIENKRSEP